MKLERRRIKAVAGRRLACFAAAFSIFLWVLCYGLPGDQSLIWLGAAVLTVSLLLWSTTGFRQAAVTVLLALFLAAGIFYGRVEPKYRAAQAMDGERAGYTVELTRYPREGSYYTVIDGGLLSGTDQKVTALIYLTELGLEPGDRVTFEGRASVNRGEYFFSSMDDGSFLTLRFSRNLEIEKPESIPWRYLPLRISNYVRQEIIDWLLDGDEGALLASLLTGGTEGMSQSFKNDLSLSGTAHITSVSGLHMAILSGAMIALFGRVWGVMAALPLMAIFGMLTGMDPPVIRSILMLAIVFLAFAVDRENDGVTTVLTALMLIGMVDPCSMVSLSLQMSFAAVAGLLLLSDPVKRTLSAMLPAQWAENRRVDALLSGIGVSVAATLASLPLTVLHFERVSILSAVTNLAVLWLIPVLMALGAAMILLWFVWPSGAGILAKYILSPLLRLFMLPVTFMAELPFSSVESGNHLVLALVLLWGFLLCIGYKLRPRMRRITIVGLLLLSAGIVGYSAWQNTQSLTCTVYGDGMVILQQGREICVVTSGAQMEDLPENFENRLYELGDLKADTLVFSGTVDQPYAMRFSAETVYLPQNSGDNLDNLCGYAAGEVWSCGDLTIMVCGLEDAPYGLMIEWGGKRILYACGTDEGEQMPEGAADLLIIDEVLACAAHQRRQLFTRVEPAQIVACDAEAGHNFDYLTTSNGPTQWLARSESVTYTYEKR